MEEAEEAWGTIVGLIPHDDDVLMQAFFWLATSERGADGGEKEWTTPLLAMANAATMEDLVNTIATTLLQCNAVVTYAVLGDMC